MKNDERTPSPSQEKRESAPEKQEPKKAPAYVPPATKEKRQKSVFKYITILFAAAFVLMLLAFMMERRQNEQVVDSLNQSVSGLRESLSNMQSAQDIYDENMELIEQINELQSENDRLTSKTGISPTARRAASSPWRRWAGSGRSTRPMFWASTACAAASLIRWAKNWFPRCPLRR